MYIHVLDVVQGIMDSLLWMHEQPRSDINAVVQRAEKDPERYMRPCTHAILECLIGPAAVTYVL